MQLGQQPIDRTSPDGPLPVATFDGDEPAEHFLRGMLQHLRAAVSRRQDASVAPSQDPMADELLPMGAGEDDVSPPGSRGDGFDPGPIAILQLGSHAGALHLQPNGRPPVQRADQEICAGIHRHTSGWAGRRAQEAGVNLASRLRDRLDVGTANWSFAGVLGDHGCSFVSSPCDRSLSRARAAATIVTGPSPNSV